MITNIQTFERYTWEEKKEFLITLYQEILPKCKNTNDRKLFEQKIEDITNQQETSKNTEILIALYKNISKKEQEIDTKNMYKQKAQQKQYQQMLQSENKQRHKDKTETLANLNSLL